jgi:hypothetical protein
MKPARLAAPPQYPPRRMFFCDCGLVFPSTEILDKHLETCERVGRNDYPDRDAKIIATEALCRRLGMSFQVYLTALAITQAGGGRNRFEMDDAEMYTHMEKVCAWYGTHPTAFDVGAAEGAAFAAKFVPPIVSTEHIM